MFEELKSFTKSIIILEPQAQ